MRPRRADAAAETAAAESPAAIAADQSESARSALPPGQSAVGPLRRGDVSLIEHVPPDQVAGLGDPRRHQGWDVFASRWSTSSRSTAATRRCAAGRCGAGCRMRSTARPCSRTTCSSTRPTDADAVCRRAVSQGKLRRRARASSRSKAHPWLAKMLVAAARKELNNAPIKLNLEYPAIPEVRAIVPKLAEAFREAGVEIIAAEVPPSQLESELRAGRRFDLAYRVLRATSRCSMPGCCSVPATTRPPEADALASTASPRILQLLLQLERAADWPTAGDCRPDRSRVAATSCR